MRDLLLPVNPLHSRSYGGKVVGLRGSRNGSSTCEARARSSIVPARLFVCGVVEASMLRSREYWSLTRRSVQDIES